MVARSSSDARMRIERGETRKCARSCHSTIAKHADHKSLTTTSFLL